MSTKNNQVLTIKTLPNGSGFVIMWLGPIKQVNAGVYYAIQNSKRRSGIWR